MGVRRTVVHGARVLLMLLLVGAGGAFAHGAFVNLRDHDRRGAALAFMQCRLAVALWALAATWWSRTAGASTPEVEGTPPPGD